MVRRIPFFLEVDEAKQKPGVNVCTKIWTDLVKKKIAPLPFATALDEARQILEGLQLSGQRPAIFVVNTFGAKDILPQFDPIMGESPVVYLRRELYTGKSGVLYRMLPDPNKALTMHVLGQMTPRLTSIWTYGAKTSDQVAHRATACLQQFLEDGDFRHFEISNKLAAS